MRSARPAVLAVLSLLVGTSVATGARLGTTGTVVAPDGVRIAVTPVRFIDGVAPPSDLDRPNFGWRYSVLELRLRNLGEGSFLVPATPPAVLVTARRAYPPWLVDVRAPGLGGVSIGPGEETTGFVTYQLPNAATPTTLRFALGRGRQVERTWSLPVSARRTGPSAPEAPPAEPLPTPGDAPEPVAQTTASPQTPPPPPAARRRAPAPSRPVDRGTPDGFWAWPCAKGVGLTAHPNVIAAPLVVADCIDDRRG